jgi:membrane protein implicated in regulation of membrane protease activity
MYNKMNIIKMNIIIKALLPTGLVIMCGLVLQALVRMSWRGYAGVLWTLGALLCVASLAMALYYIKKFFGEKDDDDEGSDQ